MNLSKIEKAIIIVLIIAAIVVGGIFLFIKPAKDNIDSSKSKLEAIQKEETELMEELSREGTIDNEIKEAKESAETLEGGFYPDLTTYEAVEITQAHLAKCNLTTLGIDAELLTTHDLELEIYEETPVVYDLKTFSQSARGTEGEVLLEGEFMDGDKKYTIVANTITDIIILDAEGNTVEVSKYSDTMKKAYKEALCKLAVSKDTIQTVSVIKVSFEVKGTYKDYLDFVDYIYSLDRATYMEKVTIPMTYEDKEAEEELNASSGTQGEWIFPCKDDTEVEVEVEIMYFGVEQMEELETIDASGVSIVVNQ